MVQSEELYFEKIFQREMKGGKKTNTMRVRFKMSFEEVWDYVFYFMEWRTTQLLLKDTKGISLQVKVSGSKEKVESPKQDGPICQWPLLRGQISVRSTALNLSSKLLVLSLRKGGRVIGF